MTDITRWEPQVKTALRKYAKHYPRNEREDISQELYLHLLKKEPELLRIEDETWRRKTVCVLLRNRIFDINRRRNKKPVPESLEGLEELSYDGNLNLSELIEGITPTEALVLEVLYKNDETQEGAAEFFGRNRSWIKQNVKLALDKLRRHM
jgi:DNA-directed RNA polymerase specialized sigma24 family protein